jgi:acyl-CoA synthetase (NDP forming)
VNALFRQAGVIRVDTLEELFDTASLLANQPVPSGRRVGIVTNAGGPGILAADALEATGLHIPELSEGLRQNMAQRLPAEASTRNPVDLIASGGPAEFEHVTTLLLNSGEVDAVMVIYVPTTVGGAGPVADAVRACQDAYEGDVPLLAVFMQVEGVGTTLAGDSQHRSIPTYIFPEAAAHALARAASHGEWRRRDPGVTTELDHEARAAIRETIDRALKRLGEEEGWLEPDEIDRILRTSGLCTPETRVARDLEAGAAARSVGRLFSRSSRRRPTNRMSAVVPVSRATRRSRRALRR